VGHILGTDSHHGLTLLFCTLRWFMNSVILFSRVSSPPAMSTVVIFFSCLQVVLGMFSNSTSALYYILIFCTSFLPSIAIYPLSSILPVCLSYLLLAIVLSLSIVFSCFTMFSIRYTWFYYNALSPQVLLINIKPSFLYLLTLCKHGVHHEQAG